MSVFSAARVRDDALVLEGVDKSFAGAPAVRALDLAAPRGSVYGLLGPNGAGKTTTLRMLMGILRPDAGTIRVLDRAPDEAGKRRVGYLPEERGLYPGMRVRDNLLFFGELKGLPREEVRRRADGWLARLGMADTAGRRLQELSKGNQQKIQFAATVLHDPELLVLDEPFTGLDPVNQDLIRRTILELSRAGTTVILSTHRMDEVERLCSHLTLLHAGRALVEGRLDAVKRRWGEDTIRVDVADDPAPLEQHSWVSESSRQGRTVELRLEGGRDPSEFLVEAARLVRIRRFEVRAPSLHSIFVRLVGGRAAPAAVPDAVGAASAPREAGP